MFIRFSCEQCNNELEVPATGEGKKAKCPACSHIMQIPEKTHGGNASKSDSRRSQGLEIENHDSMNHSDSIHSDSIHSDSEKPRIGKPLPGMPGGMDDRTLATLAHASGVIGMFSVGFLGFLGPALIYGVFGEKSPFVRAQAKEALNFQISLFLLSLVMLVAVFFTCGFGAPVLLVVPSMQLIFGIIAPLQVWSGQSYQYPMTLRLIK